MTTDAAQLAYAPPPRRRWWRRKRVVLSLLLFLAIGLFCGYRFGGEYWQPYWQQLGYLYWQDRSMRWAPAADFVVYEEDDVRAPVLRTQPGYDRVSSMGAPTSAGLAGPPAGHIPPPLNKIRPGNGGSWTSMCFVHGRYTPAGEKRLAVVGYQVTPLSDGSGRYIEIYGSGKTLATLKPGSTIDGGSPHKLYIYVERADRLRVFAGQADRDDLTRFTMRYEVNGNGGTIEGRLADDGTFRLKILDGPAAGTTSSERPPLRRLPAAAGSRPQDAVPSLPPASTAPAGRPVG